MDNRWSSNFKLGYVTGEVVRNTFTSLMRELDTDLLGKDRIWSKDRIIHRVETAMYEILKHMHKDPRDAIITEAVRERAAVRREEEAVESKEGYQEQRRRIESNRSKSGV